MSIQTEANRQYGIRYRSDWRSILGIILGSVFLFLLLERNILAGLVEPLFQTTPETVSQAAQMPLGIRVLCIGYILLAFLAGLVGLLAAMIGPHGKRQAAIFSAYAYVMACALLGSYPGFPSHGPGWAFISQLWSFAIVMLTCALIRAKFVTEGQRKALLDRVIWWSFALACLCVVLSALGIRGMLTVACLFVLPGIGWSLRHLVVHAKRARRLGHKLINVLPGSVEL